VPSVADEPVLWLPVVDGVDRLGVLEVVLATFSPRSGRTATGSTG
jgi:hypothetical protein